MSTCGRVAIFIGVTLACSSCASAFFWGSSESSTEQRPIPVYPVTAYYHQRVMQEPPPPNYPSNTDQQPVPVQIPAIPIQVPLQAQFAPLNGIQNVQLVPCLCPVTPELEYEKAQEVGGRIFVNSIKNP